MRQSLSIRAAWALAAVLSLAAAAPAADAGGDHKPPKYEAAYHGPGGTHHHDTFDLSNPDHQERLIDLIKHGHVVELENKSAPELSKMFSLRADLGIWSLIIFGLLLFVLSKLAWPKMLAGLQRREARIRDAIEEAQKARDEAAALRAQYQKELDSAHLKVKDILDEARRDAAATTDDMIAKAKSEIAAERDRAHREIVMETDQALQTIWTKAADLATQVSAAALGKQLDAAMHRRLIDEALNDLKATARN